MPKLPALTAKTVIKILEKSGFVLKRISGSHYVFVHPETKKRVIVPYHNKEVAKGTLLQILEDAGISRRDLEELL